MDELSVIDRFASGYKYTALVGTWVAQRASCVGEGGGAGEGFMCCDRGQEKALHHPLIFFPCKSKTALKDKNDFKTEKAG